MRACGDPAARRRQRQRREGGVVLAMVLVLSMLLMAGVFTFTRRAVIDATLARNRDAAASAEAIARGGLQIATFTLLMDLLLEQDDDSPIPVGETDFDVWAQLSSAAITTEEGDELSIRVHDQGALLNINALVDSSEANTSAPEESVEFLVAFFETVIDELPAPPGERALYDARELANALVDWLDADEVGIRGGDENSYYSRQSPPYEAANGPLLSVDELRRIEGFDQRLVEGMRPYVTVYPLTGGQGINLNTAPPHVLKMVYHGPSGDRRLASEETVRRILETRANGQILCEDGAADDRCIFREEIVAGSPYPPADLPSSSRAFTVEATARVRDVRRTVEAVVDRSDPADPRVVSWRVR